MSLSIEGQPLTLPVSENSKLSMRELDVLNIAYFMFQNVTLIGVSSVIFDIEIVPCMYSYSYPGIWQNIMQTNHDPMHFVPCSSRGTSFRVFEPMFDIYSMIGFNWIDESNFLEFFASNGCYISLSNVREISDTC